MVALFHFENLRMKSGPVVRNSFIFFNLGQFNFVSLLLDRQPDTRNALVVIRPDIGTHCMRLRIACVYKTIKMHDVFGHVVISLLIGHSVNKLQNLFIT
jgi:hypothetical protein